MCDCGKRIEKIIDQIKSDGDILKLASDKIRSNENIEQYQEIRELWRFFLNHGKWLLKETENNHLADCKGNTTLFLK